MTKHKTLGQVYTPFWIVSEILDLVDYRGANILNKYILEPASGDGAFLVEIVKRYIQVCQAQNMTASDIKEGLEKYIYGIELDSQAYEECIKRLNELVYQELKLTTAPDWKIFNQNTLAFYGDYLGFFDFVVGNPPYIRIHNLTAETSEFLKNNFIFSQGTIDIYLSFFEMGLKVLKEQGRLGYITPNSYLHNASYSTFRTYLKEEKLIKALIDFKSYKVFNGFSTYTAITILQKNNPVKEFEYKELIHNKIRRVNYINFEKLQSKDWSFSSAENERFLAQLTEDRPYALKDFFDVQYGFATLRDKIFIAQTAIYSKDLAWFNGTLVECSILKKVVKGSKFKGVIDEQMHILFPYKLENGRYKVIPEEKMQQDYPHAYTYLLANKEDLENRDLDKAALWYEFGRSQGVQSMHQEKIVLSTLVNGKINFYRLPAEVMVYSGLFIVKNKPHANWSMIEDVLGSEEFYKYIRLTGKDFSGGYKSITSKQIKEFKIEKNR